MIGIRGTVGANDKANKIVFSPRPGYAKKAAHPRLEYPLIYGHKCPFCGNVIQALFKAPKEFSLWGYEETVLLSKGEKNAGDIKRIYPDENTTPGKSCYRMEYSSAEGGSVKITLKNHLLRTRVIHERKYDGTGIWEEGEKVCLKTGIFSLKEDLLAKDWLLITQIDTGNGEGIKRYKLPPLETVITEGNTDFKLIQAIGKAAPIILMEAKHVSYGFYYQTQPLIKQYFK